MPLQYKCWFIGNEEDEADIAYDKAKKAAEIDGKISWEEAKKELQTEIKKEVAW